MHCCICGRCRGDPLYEKDATMGEVIENAARDGVLIANEFSLPYEKKVSYVTVAAMGRVVGELKKEIKVPFGVNIVSNPLATIDLAAAVEADMG